MTGHASVDVRSIGAGGGSIAFVDRGGLLQSGRSARAPCPGRSPTGAVGPARPSPDAALVLGFLDPDFFLGGKMTMHLAAAAAALRSEVAAPLANR